MPFIEESDLLELHKDVDKAQIINERLLDQIKFKNKDLKKLKLQRNIFGGITAAILLGIFGLWSYFSGLTTSANFKNEEILSEAVDSLDTFRTRISNLQKQNRELSLVKEFYLAKEFLDKETVYSVQVKSFVDNNVTLASEALTNTLFVKTNPFYAYSLGTFETLPEAQKFRKQLVNMGFSDAFVASYKDGKRLKIEDPY
ncbi:SPOR domain-containing protein [Flagellimonas sp.]|uniref:SPOR domain-containing protein n=1 Tax=Flagellimonas sp. TaxID=2058762 RepID=UPI003F4A2CAA